MNGKPLLIFVGGPYSNDCAVTREENVNKIHHIVKELMKMGHYILECHSLEHSFFPDNELHHADFLRQTLNWIERCDAMFLLENSPGANLEYKRAMELKIPIYDSLKDVPKVDSYQTVLDDINLKLSYETDSSS